MMGPSRRGSDFGPFDRHRGLLRPPHALVREEVRSRAVVQGLAGLEPLAMSAISLGSIREMSSEQHNRSSPQARAAARSRWHPSALAAALGGETAPGAAPK